MLADLDRLRDFLRASKGRSQERIIIEFLATAVAADPSSDHGSVLIKHPDRDSLILFNENEFLFKRKLLDPNVGNWPHELGVHGTTAGLCFRTQETKVYPQKNYGADDEFSGGSAIKNMVCVPIMTGGVEPFGVVCFHNNDPAKTFTDNEIRALESYVDVLAVALHNPLPELSLERNVFIVHGRDDASLDQLQLLLLNYRVTPKVLKNKNKGARSILDELEGLIRTCKAGFILATPDDEGHLRDGTDPLVVRARENVIFETGLLFAKFREFERVAVLLKRPLRLPSDLDGIVYEPFDNVRDIESTIKAKLETWGLVAPN